MKELRDLKHLTIHDVQPVSPWERSPKLNFLKGNQLLPRKTATADSQDSRFQKQRLRHTRPLEEAQKLGESALGTQVRKPGDFGNPKSPNVKVNSPPKVKVNSQDSTFQTHRRRHASALEGVAEIRSYSVFYDLLLYMCSMASPGLLRKS